MSRKLVTIREVKNVVPITGADRIELAFIDGWQCVVKKGQFKKGDLAAYFEIDSFLPVKPEFEFLRKGCFRKMADGSEGFRLRTISLQKQLSQGLLLPLSDLGLQNVSLGDDVTEIVQVKKYEAPIPACIAGEVRGPIPGVVRKTDQERIQNLVEYFELYKSLEFEETEKLDGASMSVYFNQGDYGVCSRKWSLKETQGNTLWSITRRLELIERMSKLGLNIAIQGEVIGEGLGEGDETKSNPYKLVGQTFKIFDIWDIDKQYYLTSIERLDLVDRLGLKIDSHVPILSYCKVFEKFPTMNELLLHSQDNSRLANVKREGVVYKSTQRIGPQIISFKVISNSLLLDEK
jgi:RNA ligase (TIGR02306 family)